MEYPRAFDSHPDLEILLEQALEAVAKRKGMNTDEIWHELMRGAILHVGADVDVVSTADKEYCWTCAGRYLVAVIDYVLRFYAAGGVLVADGRDLIEVGFRMVLDAGYKAYVATADKAVFTLPDKQLEAEFVKKAKDNIDHLLEPRVVTAAEVTNAMLEVVKGDEDED